MKQRQKSYDGVSLCAPITIPYQRFSSETAHWWAGAALKELNSKTGLRPKDFDGIIFSSFSSGPDTVVGIVQHLGLTPKWMDHIPTGGASGIMAIRRAARAVQAGDASIIACVAADTNHINSFQKTLENFSRFSQDATYPYGQGGPNATFAIMTDNYMRKFDLSRKEFGKIAISQRENALSNPFALMKKPLNMKQYMEAKLIADPIHLFDCVMPCAGAEAFIVTTPEIAENLNLSTVKICSTIERHNAFSEDPIQYRGGWAKDVDDLWHSSGYTPDDMNFAQVYDDYPLIVAMQLVDLGFCKREEIKHFINKTDFTISGTLPLNTNGGQLSAGQAGAAGGYQNVTEALRQSIKQPLGDQIPKSSKGLISGFGMVNYDRGVCTGAAVIEVDDIRW
tara:strand:+ start:48 stop:1229 length:1182 start_codon:yes stop_codon:yes gene_type:complete